MRDEENSAIGSRLPLVYLRYSIKLARIFGQDFEALLAEAKQLDAADEQQCERIDPASEV